MIKVLNTYIAHLVRSGNGYLPNGRGLPIIQRHSGMFYFIRKKGLVWRIEIYQSNKPDHLWGIRGALYVFTSEIVMIHD